MVETSIIIPTYHRSKSLLRLISSLKGNMNASCELIVVEQGDNNCLLFSKAAQKAGLHFSYFFLESVGAERAKNMGATMARGKYLIFYDDDVIIQDNAVQNMIKNFADTTVGAVAGRVITLGQREERTRTNTGRISLLGLFSDGFSSTIRQDVDTVIGCHEAWQKSVFDKAKGFDEQFTGNAMREESDLSLRIKAMGYRIVFDPAATVVHMREPHGGARKADDRLYWYFHFFSNETYFFLKHRPAVLLPIFHLTRISYILRCMFGFGREVNIRSIITPWRGIWNGMRKFIK